MAPRLEVLIDDTTARVHFFPDEGRPSATPTVTITNESAGEITAASTTGVTLSTADTTLSGAADVGDQTVPLAAVTGVEVGQTYLMTNELGQMEWVTVRGVDTAAKLTHIDERLEYAYGTTSTFQGCYFYRLLTAAETVLLAQGWRAVATYLVDSINHTRRVYFDVVKVQIHNPLTVAFVKQHLPDIMPREAMQTRGSDYAALRSVAWDHVQTRVREHSQEEGQFRPALNRTPEYLDSWAMAAFKLIGFRDHGIRQILRDIDPLEALRTLERDENLAASRCLATCSWDTDEDDSISDDEFAIPQMDLVR